METKEFTLVHLNHLTIGLAVNYTPSDILSTLYNQLNELRKTYARLADTKNKDTKVSPSEAN